MALNMLLDQVRNAVFSHADQPENNFNAGGLMGTIEGLFGQHAANTGGGGILSSSADPYGDPANRGGGILSSSQDPYGDPADQR